MTQGLLLLCLVIGIASILGGTGVLLAIDNGRAGVRQAAANLTGFALVIGGSALVGTILKALI